MSIVNCAIFGGFTMGLYENVREAAKEKGYSINRLEKELGFARSYIGKFKTITPSIDKIQKIADFLDVTTDYLMSGDKAENNLTARDNRDIAKDLDSIMAKLSNKEDGPVSYNGENLSDESMDLFKEELEIALKRLKLINKEKYNPNKNKK
jgi:transcriptional regulator with XRE-family HTH domain